MASNSAELSEMRAEMRSPGLVIRKWPVAIKSAMQ